MLVGLTFIKHGAISSQTDEMIDEPSPQFFHPPSTTIKRLVFFTELTIEEALILIEKRREYDKNKKKGKK